MLATLLSSLTKITIGAYPHWRGTQPSTKQRVYFANHVSHLDTMAIWSSLDSELRKRTRPVAAKDYWGKGGIRGLIARQALNVVLIERSRGEHDQSDPLQPLYDALEAGDSLIIFPEGTRRYEALPAPFKSGLYYLSQRFPQVEYVPVYVDNTRRSLPKGAFLPLPMTCTATYGKPLEIDPNESKVCFLARARQAVIDLSSPMSEQENKALIEEVIGADEHFHQQYQEHTQELSKKIKMAYIAVQHKVSKLSEGDKKVSSISKADSATVQAAPEPASSAEAMVAVVADGSTEDSTPAISTQAEVPQPLATEKNTCSKV